MRATTFVHVLQRLEQLLRDFGRVSLVKVFVLNDAVKQLAATHQIQHEIYRFLSHIRLLKLQQCRLQMRTALVFTFSYLFQANEARMLEILHDENFSL
jgi:hypothetical protein